MYFVYILERVGGKNVRGRRTYVGKTNNPGRRLAQHLGIKTGGARATRGFKWKMKYLFGGFPTNSAALQFEYTFKRKYKSKELGMVMSRSEAIQHVNRQMELMRANPVSPTWKLLRKGLFTMLKRRFTANAPLTESMDLFVIADPDPADFSK